jgi:hypothetical protein
VLIVEAASLLSVAVTGALSLWSQGIALADVRAGVSRTPETTGRLPDRNDETGPAPRNP